MEQTTSTTAVLIYKGKYVPCKEDSVQEVYQKERVKTISKEILDMYMDGGKHSLVKSEERRMQIWVKIWSTRAKIRAMAQEIMIKDNTAVGKLIDTVVCTLESNSRYKEHLLRKERAKECGIPAKYINVQTLKRKKGIITVDMNDVN